MKSHARVVIIGGGVMGVSLAYHLTRRGWNDIVLVEKNELTAGSTWHAAGLCTHFAHNPTVMELRATSVRLYRDVLPRETGESVGFHPCGALRVTRSEDRMDEFRQVQGLGRFVGYDFNILNPAELAEIYPLCQLDGIVGAIHEPDDGHVDPSLATNAMAAGARKAGAEIYRHNEVTSISRSGGEWKVETKNGEIIAEHIVNASGTWCREIGLMMGIDLPVVPMLHQYLVTDQVPEIAARIEQGLPELPMIRDPEESWYLRQERDGYILGPYEKDAVPWSVDGVPPEFGMELLPPDLDRVEHIIENAMARVPAVGNAGIKTIVNGPITFTPDANPLIGPAFSLPDAWLLTGSSMGVMEGGGAGSFLADWMVDGQPPFDALAIDGRRFGGYADRSYRLDKAIECFGLQFGVHYPFEERDAGRPAYTTPIYEIQKSQGAVFGFAYGFERPNWFSSGDPVRESELTFAKPGWFDAVAAECRHIQHHVGVADLTPFAKFNVRGRDAHTFVSTLGANTAPRANGKIGLTHVLTPGGGVASEFTVTRVAEDHFYLTSAAAAARHDEDLLRTRSAGFNDVSISNDTAHTAILAVMGPDSEAVLAQLTDQVLDASSFPWLTTAQITLAGTPVRAMRVSYVGESGFELHFPIDQMKHVYESILDAGHAHDIKPFGAFAMNSMRLEKGYRAWGMDLTTERTPLEAGLDALVKTKDREFVGREAILERAASATAWRMELLEVEFKPRRVPFGVHSLFQADQPVGMITSAAYGHRTGKLLALALLRPEATAAEFTAEVVGEKMQAWILNEPPYDPENRILRAGG